MSTKTSTNGQVRKSLSEQIDRLDGMLDGLAEGLNDAVGAAVQQAVQAVLREVLTNPEMLARFQATAPAAVSSAPAPATPKPKGGWKRRWASVRQAVAAWTAAARMECGRRLGQAQHLAVGAWNRVCFVGRFSYPVLAAAAVGVTAGITACFARPWLAAAVSALGGVAAMIAMQVRTAWGRLLTSAIGSMGVIRLR